MTAWSSYGLSRAISGENDVIIRPKYPRSGATGVLYCHGAGGMADQALATEFAAVLNDIASAGHPVLACDLGGIATWGNDTVLARINSAKTYLQSTLSAPSGPVLMVGASMGGLSCLVWAKNNPTDCAGVIGLVPVSDVTDIHTNNRQGLASSIDSAYAGGWSEAVYGAARNPVTFASSLSSVPMLLFSGTTDTVVLPSTVTALAAGSGATHISVEGGHGGWIAPLDPIRTFVAAHTA